MYCQRSTQTFTARHLLPDIYCQTFTAKHLLPDIYCQTFTARHLLPEIYCQTASDLLPKSTVRDILPDIYCQISTARHLLTDIYCQISTARYFLQEIYCRHFTSKCLLLGLAKLRKLHLLQGKLVMVIRRYLKGTMWTGNCHGMQ